MTTAEELIADAQALLLDFDGPVTALMPPPLNRQAADQARAALDDLPLPDSIISTTDHLAVLRWTYQHAVGRLDEVESACTSSEVECAQRSEPSPEIAWLLARAEQASLRLAIVSNNSERAVRIFLRRFGWLGRFAALVCRTPETSRLLKPHPFLVTVATQFLEVPPQHCVFLGDSVSDVRAGQAAGVPVIGLAKTPTRGDELRMAGAAALLHRGRLH